MKNITINVVVLDTTENVIHAKSIERDLDTYYKTINCDLIDIVERKIGNNYYDIICDDEGLFKEGNPTAIITTDNDDNMVEQIVGSVIICSHDDDGGTIGLTDKQIDEVLANTFNITGRVMLHATL